MSPLPALENLSFPQVARITTRTKKKNNVKCQWSELETQEWECLAGKLKCLAPLSMEAGADRIKEPSGTPGGGE